MNDPQVELIELQTVEDSRGILIPINFKDQLKFNPARSFLLTVSSPQTIRGQHAHIQCLQAIQCLQGEVKITLIGDNTSVQHCLSSSNFVLLIPVLTWVSIEFKTSDSYVIVYASHPYDESDYLRDFDDFQKIASMTRFGGVN
jgi:UDP-2-acetamido-3-amino-2,3-dideoxy-glucuronate N-acetyltransferase